MGISKAWLLGVDWGNLPSIPNLLGDQVAREAVPSGMAAVIPAPILGEFLDGPPFVEIRQQGEEQWKVMMDELENAGKPSMDSAPLPPEGMTKGEFDEALGKATGILTPDESAPEG